MAKKIKIRSEKPEEAKLDPESPEGIAAKEAEDQAAAVAVQDEFQVKGFELMTWTQEHPALLLGIIGFLLVAGLGYVATRQMQASTNEKASAAYGEALRAYDAPIEGENAKYKTEAEKYTAALDGFKAVASGHVGTGVADIAQLYIGHSALKLGKYDDAITAYTAFLAQADANDPLRFAGLAGLATAAENKGDQAKAIATWAEASALTPAIGNDAALFASARLAMRSGDSTKAKPFIERLAKEFPDSPLKSQAEALVPEPSATP